MPIFQFQNWKNLHRLDSVDISTVIANYFNLYSNKNNNLSDISMKDSCCNLGGGLFLLLGVL